MPKYGFIRYSYQMDERIINLEMKLAFQEDLLSQLNESLVSQQKEIDYLTGKTEILSEKIKELEEKDSVDRPNRKPPHY